MIMSFIANSDPPYIYSRSVDAFGSGHFIKRVGILDYGIMIEDISGHCIFFSDSDEYNTNITQWNRMDMKKYAEKFGYPVKELMEIKETFAEMIQSFNE